MKKGFFSLLILLSISASGQAKSDTNRGNGPLSKKEFDISWISDQNVVGINKEKGHATFIPYSSTNAMVRDNFYNSPWLLPSNANYLDLNGTWKFKWVAG